MTLEVNTGDMAIEDDPSHQYSIAFCCCVTEGQSNRMATDAACERCVTEFLHVKKLHPLAFTDAY